jgi:uroporphyrinogen-III synthase
MVSGGFADLASDRLTTTSKAALDYAKMKLGQKDTAIGQLLTALYTPPPVAVGQTTTQYQQSRGGGK